eukprot:scaffold67437_cov19-Tisochrysis_lutea.AAC.2
MHSCPPFSSAPCPSGAAPLKHPPAPPCQHPLLLTLHLLSQLREPPLPLAQELTLLLQLLPLKQPLLVLQAHACYGHPPPDSHAHAHGYGHPRTRAQLLHEHARACAHVQHVSGHDVSVSGRGHCSRLRGCGWPSRGGGALRGPSRWRCCTGCPHMRR